MKRLLAVLMFLAPLPASAGSLEDLYLFARDHSIAEFKKTANAKGKANDARVKAQERALAKLEEKLRNLVGPFVMKGLPRRGKSNLDTLFAEDQGYGMLDGMRYAAADGRTSVVVSTDSLATSWLQGHRQWWPGHDDLPQNAEAAVRTEAFYTQGISTDAAVVHYAELPLAKPPQARFAYAVLAARTQSEAPPAPGEILVAVLQAGRLFIVSAPAPGVTPIAACDAVTADFARRAAEASDAYQASIPGDNTLAAVADRLREEGEAAFKLCFAAHAKDEAFFRPAIAQAQALADALPAN